jgi:DNA-binding HxlR family transcriptional regulator
VPGKRTYADPCGVARALDVVGERWALLVVRELLLGPKRFSDLRTGLPHVGPDVLSQRLRELEQAGLVRRDQLPPPAASRVYELTERGHELEPVVLALGRWGSRAPFAPGRRELGVDSLVLALKTLYDPARADGVMGATFALHLGESQFTVRVAESTLEAVRAVAERPPERPAERPTATITATPGVLQSVLWHERPARDALRAGELTIDGDRRAGERFLRLFPLPA